MRRGGELAGSRAAARPTGGGRRARRGRRHGLGLAASRRRHGDGPHRDDGDGRDGRLANAAGGVVARLRGADLHHVVGDDGGDDAAQRGANAAAVRPRQPRKRRRRRALAPTALFATGYLLAWGGFSVSPPRCSGAWSRSGCCRRCWRRPNHWLGAGILVAAGLWQLTPIQGGVPTPLPHAARLPYRPIGARAGSARCAWGLGTARIVSAAAGS